MHGRQKQNPGGVAIDAEHFPDESFRVYICKFDTNQNNVLSDEEIQAVTRMKVNESGIKNYAGIEYFTNLESLDCSNTGYNWSAQKSTGNELDVSKNTKLESLKCSGNYLAKLIIPSGSALKYLDCSDNRYSFWDGSKYKTEYVGLSSLDFSDSAKMKYLNCSGSGVKELRLATRSALTYLDCSDNRWQAEDRSYGNMSYQGYDGLTSLDLSDSTKLEYLNCSNTMLSELDLSENKKLKKLECYNGNRSYLSQHNNYDNYYDWFGELNVIRTYDLEGIENIYGGLLKLDLSNNTELEYLDCSGNARGIIDRSDGEDQLSAIGLSELNLSKNYALQYLNCSYNYNLKALDLSRNYALKELDCLNSSFKETHTEQVKVNDYSTRGINVYGYYGGLSELNVSKNRSLERLNCSDSYNLKTITAADNPILEKIECGSTFYNCSDYNDYDEYFNVVYKNSLLESLDISGCPELKYLDCSYASLKTLDTGNNAALKELICKGNNLSALDLSKNPKLKKLECYDNDLAALDFRKNTRLRELYYDAAKLKVLNLNVKLSQSLDLTEDMLWFNYRKYRYNLSQGDNLFISTKKWEVEYDDSYDCDKMNVENIAQPGIYTYEYTQVRDDNGYWISADKQKTETIDCTVTYVNKDGSPVAVNKAKKDFNWVAPHCEHLYTDYEHTTTVSDEPVVIYGGGGKIKSDDQTINYKEFVAYTDIGASYNRTLNAKKKVKSTAGKVIVGITKSDEKPAVVKNKINSKETAKIAKAKIKNGQVTVTAAGKESGLVYLWIIDTGKKGIYECCPINVQTAPTKMTLKDGNGSEIKKNYEIEEGTVIKVHVDGVKPVETEDANYTAIVPSKSSSYISAVPCNEYGDEFEVRAVGTKNGKKTKAAVEFVCDQNNKKLKFTFTITPSTTGKTES